ncbi:hypothetical protein HOA59_00670 [archaeon]|jgi:tRNA nucleotidyltransferase (CCA-adding enzyme)|nr:hypothetical protein [archaeon]MBT6823933.1 hypothetical protein [archaeon]MBT7107163.1 hypothetical protein [archaeon]MBT7297767.1 hypothetical protein [archaeon]
MDILKEISPTKQEKKELKKKVNSFLKSFKKSKGVKFVVGGSYAKNTWLSGNPDIDVFARFDYKTYKDKDISKELGDLLSKKYKFTKVHGSRDYYHIDIDKTIFEVVPVLEIKKPEEAKNVTDVSAFHVKYIKKHTNKKLQNEIRILKHFCKANDLYGAESYIRGFSGYVLEILISHYKSFNKLIKSVKLWEEKTVLDPAKYYKSKREIGLELNPSKVSPLILIDPVQPDRNAAAALGKKVYNKLINLAKIYDGSDAFFRKKEVDLKDLKGYNILSITPLTGKKDIVGAKLLKSLEYIKKQLELNDFKVIDYGWKWETKAYFWFKIESPKSKTKKHYGPTKDKKTHIEAFKKKHKKQKIHKGIKGIYIIQERRFTKSEDILNYLIKQKNVSEKLKNIKLR